MPEVPDLVVIKEFLAERIVGQEIVSARVLKPSVVRSLAGDFQDDIQGRTIDVVDRRGKWLIFRRSGARLILINSMLTGARGCSSGPASSSNSSTVGTFVTSMIIRWG